MAECNGITTVDNSSTTEHPLICYFVLLMIYSWYDVLPILI